MYCMNQYIEDNKWGIPQETLHLHAFGHTANLKQGNMAGVTLGNLTCLSYPLTPPGLFILFDF